MICEHDWHEIKFAGLYWRYCRKCGRREFIMVTKGR